ncbi:MAG: response regulator transcription factor [Caldilineaceae bacterium]|nr:response regulator transcription factor [Caldilineaceae bacterium]
MASIRLLIVEDHDFFRRTIALLLGTEERIEIVGAVASGAEAIRLVSALRPDVVLMDLNLPDTPGLVVIGEVTSYDDAPAVLVLTGADEVENVLWAFAAGAAGYLRKEMVGEELLVSAIFTVACGGVFLDPKTFARLRAGFIETG